MSRVRVGRGQLTLIGEQITGGMDGWLLTVIAGLCAFGAVMVYSASTHAGILCCQNPNYFFVRQLGALALGVTLMVIAARFDYHRLRGLTRSLVLFTLALLVFVLVPHIGTSLNGARRWFVVGPLSLQPSAVAALIAIVGLGRWLQERGPQIRTWRGVRDYCIIVSGLLGLILLEKDLGTAIVAGSVAFVMLMLSGARKRHLVLIVGVAAIAGFGLIKVEAYRSARLSTFANPFLDPLNTGYQPVNALEGLGTGGLTGVGLGNSIEAANWLPEAHTDFIFAIIGEELGLIGTLSVVGSFVFLGWRGVRAAMRAPDSYGSLLAGGITAWICIQAFINIAAVTDVIPTTGIPLPFISYGGSALVMTLVAMGILCNISAQGRRQGDLRRAHSDSWRRDRGTSDSRARARTGAATPGSGR